MKICSNIFYFIYLRETKTLSSPPPSTQHTWFSRISKGDWSRNERKVQYFHAGHVEAWCSRWSPSKVELFQSCPTQSDFFKKDKLYKLFIWWTPSLMGILSKGLAKLIIHTVSLRVWKCDSVVTKVHSECPKRNFKNWRKHLSRKNRLFS